MAHRLVKQPSIIPFAVPSIVPDGFEQFIKEAGLAAVIEEAGHESPIGRISSHILDRASSQFTDAEMLVEFGGRQCYRAWRKGRDTEEYIENILDSAHGSVLAHAHFSFHISGVSRALSHELIRHAAGVDISQESQRYVDANATKFVVPPILLSEHFWDGDLTCQDAKDWLEEQVRQVESYNRWQEEISVTLDRNPALTAGKRSEIIKRANEAARASLPNSCETRMLWTANARALRHILMLRGDPAADLEIRRFAVMLTPLCKSLAPTMFADIESAEGSFGVGTVVGKYAKV